MSQTLTVLTDESILGLRKNVKPSSAPRPRILRNQLIAKEGVLPFPSGGKLKRWEDLSKNIGRIVPVLDEHPSYDNGNFGLYSGKEQIYGYARLKQCPNNPKALCADIELMENAPRKRGYSIGYPYSEIEESGKYGDSVYVAVQKILFIDHVAMTDIPRDPAALRKDSVSVSADSEGKRWETGRANKYFIGYDTLKITSNSPSPQPSGDPSSAGSPDSYFLPEKTSEVIASEERNMSDEEKAIMKENAELRAKLAELQAIKTAADSYEEKVRGLEEKVKSLEKTLGELKAENDSLKKEKEAMIKAKAAEQAKELVERFGFDAKELEDKDPTWIDIAYTTAVKIAGDTAKPAGQGATPVKKIDKEQEVGQDADEDLTGVVFRWDPKTGKSVPIGKFM